MALSGMTIKLNTIDKVRVKKCVILFIIVSSSRYVLMRGINRSNISNISDNGVNEVYS